MPLLHIALQTGFSDDSVSIRVDNQEVFNRTGITDKNQSGPAATLELNLAPGLRQVKVSMPIRQTSAEISLELRDHPLYLGILLTPTGKITHQIAHEPFRYI
jgi:hypothetical protein